VAKNGGPEMAIVLAGGVGSRLGDLTDVMPKPMLTVNGKPIIEHIVREIVANRITEIKIAVGYRADKIMGYLNDGKQIGAKIAYYVEKKPLGTGGALKAILQELRLGQDEVAFVSNADELFHLDIKKMNATRIKMGTPVTLALKKVDSVVGFGVVKMEGGLVTSFIEKPDSDETEEKLISMGKYLMDGRVLEMLPTAESFSLERDFFHKVAGDGKISGYITDAVWYPTDNLERYERACREWK
jgi:NDP-sugar pyrophosphorylase family protein